MTRKLKNTLIIVLTFMMTLCGSFAFSGLLARAELVSPSKEDAQTLVSIYKNGLQSGMDLVWGTATTDLGYVNSSDTQNEGKTLAVDCTHAANTEFYIDFGKDYDIYTGAGFSSETLENFYKKSAVEFWIKLNDTPASFFNIYLFQSRGEEYASAPANQRYIRSNVQLKSYVDATIIGEWQYVQVPFTAFSSNGEYVDENNVKVKDTPVNLAKVCAIGAILSCEGKNLYITGDTLYAERVFDSLPAEKIDALFLPINGKGNNMNAADAARFARRIGAKNVVPVHFGMFDDLTGQELQCENKIIPEIYKEIVLK